MCVVCLQAMSIPAIRKPASLVQGGSDLTVRLHGDEFYSYYTTDDGYTIVRNQLGQWEYARQQGGRLVPTGVAAHNASHRQASEHMMLSAMPKCIHDEALQQQGQQLREQLRQEVQRRARFNYKRFRGLIVLVEYTDKSFEMSNPQDFYNHMVNDKNYTGYTLNGKRVNCPGSVRDYYYDQSNGMFDPVFDVVGPVKVNYASTAHRKASSSPSIFISALKAIDSQVDFTKYDGDDDGTIDLVFFIGAGPASCYEGNDDNLLWPHKYSFYLQSLTTRLDGMRPYDYACCTEIYGFQDTPSSLETQGIGVMCHEFSHVLGLMDHYDVNGSANIRPLGEWDIMDDGAAHNVARTPAAYTLFERWSLGWCNPTVITQPGTYELNAIDGTSDGYILRTSDSNEYFTLENRQNTTKWDRFLPGHGMLLMRVDSASTTAWTTNKVNTNANHLYYELRRAWNNTIGTNEPYDMASDPFPGTKKITKISNTTTPNLVTWSGRQYPYAIQRIQEKNGVISFFLGEEGAEKKVVETFEKLPVGLAAGTEAKGDIATWKTGNATIASYSNSKRVSMTMPSTVQMTTPVYYDMYQVEVEVVNPSTSAKFALYYSIDGGTSWSTIGSQQQAAGEATTKLTWDVEFSNDQAILFRLAMVGGSKTTACYVDNFTIYYNGEAGVPEPSDKKLLETFDKLPTNLTAGTEAQGDIAMWKLGNANAAIANYDGSRQVSMSLPSTIQTTTPLYYNTIQVATYIDNPQTSIAKFALYCSTDGGSSWTQIKTSDGDNQLQVDAGTKVRGTWDVAFNNNQPVLYRLAMVGGVKSAPCYVDNFTIYYTGEPGPEEVGVRGDLNNDGIVDVSDVNIMIDMVLGKTEPNLELADLDGNGIIDVTDVNAIIDIVLGK